MIILFFGQPASGKTTLADLFATPTTDLYADFIRVDGDKWRDLTKNKDYSKQGRINNLKSAFAMAKFLDGEGFTPVLSFVTPYEELREYLCENNNVIFIYLKYHEDRGRNKNFANDFESPTHECLIIDTTIFNIEQSLEKSVDYYLTKKSFYE